MVEPVLLIPGCKRADNRIASVQAVRNREITDKLQIRIGERNLHLESTRVKPQLPHQVQIL